MPKPTVLIARQHLVPSIYLSFSFMFYTYPCIEPWLLSAGTYIMLRVLIHNANAAGERGG